MSYYSQERIYLLAYTISAEHAAQTKTPIEAETPQRGLACAKGRRGVAA
jgi:hypothetical protein